MKRRKFVKLCASAVVGVSASPDLLAEASQELHPYERVALVDGRSQKPISAASLEVGETYLFHYPYVTTPCFLLDLGRPIKPKSQLKTREGERYRWPGGSGPNRSVVAFSAICAHRMSHPARNVSFINYRHEDASFRNRDNELVKGKNVIYCCSEKSVYDPARGAEVLGGPAPQPLAAIALDYVAEEDSFYAIATVGGEMFARYFASFGQRLVLDHARTDIQKTCSGNTELMRMSEYCRNPILC